VVAFQAVRPGVEPEMVSDNGEVQLGLNGGLANID